MWEFHKTWNVSNFEDAEYAAKFSTERLDLNYKINHSGPWNSYMTTTVGYVSK